MLSPVGQVVRTRLARRDHAHNVAPCDSRSSCQRSQAASMEDTDSPASDGRESEEAGGAQLMEAATTPTSQPDGDGAWFAPPRFPPHARAALAPPPVPFVASVAMPGAPPTCGLHEPCQPNGEGARLQSGRCSVGAGNDISCWRQCLSLRRNQSRPRCRCRTPMACHRQRRPNVIEQFSAASSAKVGYP